ncbi:MAG TPA: M14 metallopeptidase family protein [Blastocatellia bacterium]|nr:M14 metallopeptidase family protein [Blastocatellia bacterium]
MSSLARPPVRPRRILDQGCSTNMTFRPRLYLSSLVVILLAASSIAAQADMPSPRDALGFEPGEDRKLAEWSQIVDYFKRLDTASPRVSVHQMGVSTERRPFIVAIISSEKNIENLPRIRQAQARLADPRRIATTQERQQLIAETPVIVAITCSIHSTEIVASQMAMQLAYNLASDNSARTKEILASTVLLLIPSVNPDGIDIVTDWYRKTLGTKFEGTSPPVLYHRYAGHDNNRDWFMLTQAETQMVSNLFWREWFPEIVYDVHQQGQFGSRMCVPPFFDPHNPNIDPVIVRQVGAIGMRMASNLTAAGYRGVVTNSTYDMWWHGGLRSAPYYHNAIGILTEAASVRIATPLDVRREQLRASTRGLANPLVAATNFPLVWEGGRWSMRDILNMELITCRTVLEEAALRREELIRNFVDIAERAIETGKREAPYAYIIPDRQHDALTADRMINILVQQGVEVHRAKSDFTVDGKKYEEGSYVVLLAQPYRANVKCLFEPQRYPDRRLYPGGPAEPPYDVAGWTLPMQMGVDYIEAKSLFNADLEKLNADFIGLKLFVSPISRARSFFLSPDQNKAFDFINSLFKTIDSVTVSRLRHSVNVDGKDYAAGTFVIQDTSSSRQRDRRKPQQRNSNQAGSPGLISSLAIRHGINLDRIPDKGIALDLEVMKDKLVQPRVALYRSWMGSMDEGWTRWVLEQFGFDFKNIYDADVRAGNLKNSFDVIILPDQSMQQIVSGNRAGSYPPEYTGGITEAGVANLKSFVEAGGVLVCLNASSEMAVKRFDLPVKNVLDGMRRDQFYAPGSIFRATVDISHPVAYGMPAEADLYFVSGSRSEEAAAAPDADSAPRATSAQSETRATLVRAFAFEITDPARARTVARYTEGNPLRSGWLLGPQHVAGKSALVDVDLGKGRVVLFGFRTQHRAQTWGTFKLLFNSIMLGGLNQKEAAGASRPR